jgi:hypothetical protein
MHDAGRSNPEASKSNHTWYCTREFMHRKYKGLKLGDSEAI